MNKTTIGNINFVLFMIGIIISMAASFIHGWEKGGGLAVYLIVLNIIASIFSALLMWIYEKIFIQEKDIDAIYHASKFGLEDLHYPVGWKIINNIIGFIVFVMSLGAIIYGFSLYFL